MPKKKHNWFVRFIKWILSAILVFVGLTVQASAERSKYNEEYFTQLLAKEHGFTIGDTLPNRLRPDLYHSGTYAVEVDWAYKKYEALAQPLVYAYFTGLKPGVVILVEKDKEFDGRIREVMAKYNVQIWIVEITKQEGIIHSIKKQK